MRNCISCNKQLDLDVNFCSNCGSNQNINTTYAERNTVPSVLLTICILTIVGSLFTILRAFFYEIFASVTQNEGVHIRGYMYTFTSVGTIIGAIIMISRNIKGLYIYTVCQVLYIITIIIAMFSHGNKGELVINFSMLFLIPAILFLVFYWSKEIRQHLN